MRAPLLPHLNLSLGLSLLLLISACSKPAPQTEKAVAVARVKTQPLSTLSVPVQYSAPATAASLNESTLKAEISARIETIPARVGDRVKQGQLLVALNCADAHAQQQQAAANTEAATARAELAQQQLQRARALQQKRSVSEELLSQREAQATAAKAEAKARSAAHRIARNQAQRCNIKAPYNAIVVARNGQVGELASPGTPMISIVSTDDLEIAAEIIPADAESLNRAETIQFLASQAYPVELRAITHAIGSLTRTRAARLRFIDQSPLPGTPGRLRWSDARPGLPSEYLSERQGQLGVFIAERNIVKFIALPHAQEGRAVAVDFPLSTQIVTTGRSNVKAGETLAADSLPEAE